MTSLSIGQTPSGPVRIMFDLETLSTAHNACILSIGAVVFGTQSKAPEGYCREFYRNVDDRTGAIDVQTVMWWFAQSEEARSKLLVDRRPLDQAVFEFATWCSMHATGTLLGIHEKKADVEFWSRSPSFDEVILGTAFGRAFSRAPFFHRWSRDCRTIETAAGVPYEPKGLAHHALADAYSQAEHVLQCLAKVRC